jgi:hypothetical protein
VVEPTTKLEAVKEPVVMAMVQKSIDRQAS